MIGLCCMVGEIIRRLARMGRVKWEEKQSEVSEGKANRTYSSYMTYMTYSSDPTSDRPLTDLCLSIFRFDCYGAAP